MDYDMYLFSCLLKEFNKEFAEQPYDWQYDVLTKLYEKFETSLHNDVNKSAYDCMINYLNSKEYGKSLL
jgi:hypothetical protein